MGDLGGLLAIAVASLFMVAGGTALYGGVGSLDPWIYTGYIHDYGGTLARFGRTYYSTRVTAIWPQGTLYSAIGEPAYEVWRWIVLATSGGGLAVAIRAFSNRWAGYCAGTALIFFSPLLIAIADDYTHPVAFAYALLAFAAIVQRHIAWTLVAGILASAAIGAHEISIYLVAPMLVAVIAVALPRMGPRALGLRMALFITGAVGLQVALSLIMGATYGWIRANVLFQEAAIKFAISLGEGAASNWSVPWDNSYGRITTALIVTTAWLAIAAATSFLARTRRVALRIVGPFLAALTVLLMVVINHVVFQAGFVGILHTVAIIAVATSACAWVALGLLTSGGANARGAAITGLVLAITFGFLIANPASNADLANTIWWSSAALALTTAAVALVANRWLHARHLLQMLVIGVVVLAGVTVPLAPLTTAERAGALYNAARLSDATDKARQQDARDLRGIAVHVQSLVRRHVPSGTPVAFWYPNHIEGRGSPLGAFDSVQSVFLWLYSCVECEVRHPFPEIAEDARMTFYNSTLASSPVGALVVLANSRRDASRALESARRPPLNFTHRDLLRKSTSGGLTIWVGIASRSQPDLSTQS